MQNPRPAHYNPRILPALNNINHVIQLTIAPIFLLTAIGTVLNVLAEHLGRAIDQHHALIAAMPKLDVTIANIAHKKITFEVQHIQLIYILIS